MRVSEQAIQFERVRVSLINLKWDSAGARDGSEISDSRGAHQQSQIHGAQCFVIFDGPNLVLILLFWARKGWFKLRIAIGACLLKNCGIHFNLVGERSRRRQRRCADEYDQCHTKPHTGEAKVRHWICDQTGPSRNFATSQTTTTRNL